MRSGWILATSSWHSMDPGADVAAVDGVDRDEEEIGRVDSVSIESCLPDVSVELVPSLCRPTVSLWLDWISSSSVIGKCDLFQFCHWICHSSSSPDWKMDLKQFLIGWCDHFHLRRRMMTFQFKLDYSWSLPLFCNWSWCDHFQHICLIICLFSVCQIELCDFLTWGKK